MSAEVQHQSEADVGGDGGSATVTGAPRYAIYFVPPLSSALARFGETWFADDLGARCGLGAERAAALTESARMYGFHGTLKPPMRLRPPRSPGDLSDALHRFCHDRERFDVAPLEVARLGGFLALRPSAPAPALDRLAADCVEGFDHFRAPPGEAELARRRRARLSDAQESLLQRWGYPYVFDEFRFHMTLSTRLTDEAEAAALEATARALAADVLAAPMRVDGLALSRQSGPGAPFEVIERFFFR